MNEELEVLAIVTRRLDGPGIPYMVTGSMAMNYYGRPRMTRDIDLGVELSAADTERVSRLFERDFYVDPAAVERAVRNEGLFNLIHSEMVVKVDCIVRKDSEYRRTEFARRRLMSVEGRAVHVVAPEDLIISKLAWARDTRSETQLGDVRNLLQSVSDLDRGYLDSWVGRLGLASILREAGSGGHARGRRTAVPRPAARAAGRGAGEDGPVDVCGGACPRPGVDPGA